MSADDKYEQYGYDNYDDGASGAPRSGFYGGMKERFTSPGFASFVLLGLSVGVVWYALTAEPNQQDLDDLPIIRADAQSYKSRPQSLAKFDSEARETTIFNRARGRVFDEQAPVENLLAEQPVDKLKEFASEAETLMEDKPMPQNLLAAVDEAETPATDVPDQSQLSSPAVAEEQVLAAIQMPVPTKKPATVAPQQPAAQDTQAVPEKLHAPASSPDTLAFVRSALEHSGKKGAGTPAAQPATTTAAASPAPTQTQAAETAAQIEPAAGFASGDRRYYVQLSSITDPMRSEKEWGKLQNRYPMVLDNTPHRVQKADLGDRGIYFRIQAGPFEREKAANLCSKIKTVNPSGCFVVE